MFVFEKEVKYGNALVEKSFTFSVRIVRFYLFLLKNNKHIEPILKQVLRSGTSIGANVSESQSAYTKKDFINKLGISLKESRETEYWLKLLKETDLIGKDEFESLNNDCIELIKLLTAIIKKAKSNTK